MKKNKCGFTLAETLITMGIVGIVAALVIPKLVTDTGRSANAASLSRAKELVEQSMLNIIQTANRNSSGGTGVGINTLAGIERRDLTGSNNAADAVFIINNDGQNDNLVTKTTALTGIKEFTTADNFRNNRSYRDSIRMYDGDDFLSGTYDDVSNDPTYKFDKSDAIIIYRPITDEIPNDIADDRVLTRIIIDVNGEKEPNRVGRDVFVFGLANNGHLYPAGSAAYNNNIMGENLAVFPNTCTNNAVGDGRTCAARVASEGWKINY